jgi:general secretion pathway protein C
MAAETRRGLVLGGGALIILLLLYILLRGSPEPLPEVEPVAPSTPPPVVAAPTPEPVAPVQPPGDIATLRLYGLLASGAVLGFPDGSQRLIPIGREALPGLTLKRIEQHAAIFDSGGGEVRLGFDGAAQAAVAHAAPPAPASSSSAERDETLRYRLGLAPRRVGGRVDGFTVRPGADMPALARAGIQPGDVILGVNGGHLDEERMLELAWQIANSEQTVFEVERGGRRMRLSLPGRPQ